MKKIKLFSSIAKDYWIFLLLVTVFAISLSLINVAFTYYNLQKELRQIQIDNSERIRFSIVNSLYYTERLTNLMANQIADKGNNPKMVADILYKSARNVNHRDYNIFTWTLFDFVTNQGDVVASSVHGVIKNPTKVFPEQREWIISSKTNPWSLQFSEIDIGIVSGEPILPVGYGVTDKKNNFLGIISFGINIDKLQNKLETYLTSDLMSFIILDHNQNFITASSDIKQNIYQQYLYDYNLSDLSVDSNIMLDEALEVGDAKFNFYFKDKKYPLLFLIGLNKEKVSLLFKERIVPKLLQILYATLFFMILIYYFFKVQLVNPILRLSIISHKLSKGQTEIDIPKFQIKEISELANSLRMAKDFIIDQKEEKRRIENANIQKSLFLSSTSHEIKNIIHGAKGFSELQKMNLSSKLEQLNLKIETGNLAKIEKSLMNNLKDDQNIIFSKDEFIFLLCEVTQNIDKSLDELNDFINDLLDVAQAESGNFRIDLQSEVDMIPIISRSIKLLKNRAFKSMIKINSNIDDYKKNEVLKIDYIDPRRIKQILINLISNAIKYSPDNSIIEVNVKKISDKSAINQINKKINDLLNEANIDNKRKKHLNDLLSQKIASKQPKLEIAIIDQGFGMDDKELKIAFSRYGIVDNKNKGKVDSLGLGLCIVKELVEGHGGLLEVISQKNKGTVVKITL